MLNIVINLNYNLIRSYLYCTWKESQELLDFSNYKKKACWCV